MTKVFLASKEFTNNEGETIQYDRLVVTGKMDDEELEVVTGAGKLKRFVAQQLLKKPGTTVSYVPLRGLVIQGTINGRLETVEVDLDNDQRFAIKMLLADDYVVPSAPAPGDDKPRTILDEDDSNDQGEWFEVAA